MTDQYQSDDITTGALIESTLELIQQTPDMTQRALETLAAHLVLITEAAYASNEPGLIQAVDAIWNQVNVIDATSTNQTICVNNIGIALMAMKMQRDAAYKVAAKAEQRATQAEKRAAQLAGLKGA